LKDPIVRISIENLPLSKSLYVLSWIKPNSINSTQTDETHGSCVISTWRIQYLNGQSPHPISGWSLLLEWSKYGGALPTTSLQTRESVHCNWLKMDSLLLTKFRSKSFGTFSFIAQDPKWLTQMEQLNLFHRTP